MKKANERFLFAKWTEWTRWPIENEEETLRLISFTYGPKPTDWQFWFTEELDKSFIEFWDIIEHLERSISVSNSESYTNSKDGYDDDSSDEELITA
jgi:hypothetical protein